MKKVYVKPEIQAIELKQQGCLLAGSGGDQGAKHFALPGGEDIIPVPEGIDDDDV